MTVRAIFENGVFRPTEQVNLPEKSRVEFEPKIIADGDQDDVAAQERIYELLGRTMESGETDVAERHDEHQP